LDKRSAFFFSVLMNFIYRGWRRSSS